MKKMNKRVKALWVKALRSGKYKQTKGQLKHGSRYCCLGVLTDLYLKEVAIPKFIKSGGWDRRHEISCDCAHLDSDVCAWAGLNENNPSVDWYGENVSLASMNDGDGGVQKHNFKEIAKIIEKNL